jgi:cytochrome c oxidase subunit 3
MTTDNQALATVPVQHDPLEHFGHDKGGGISNPILGMMLFITSEVMFFAGLFAAYFNSRAGNTPWPPEEFAHSLQIMPFVGPATVLLILSSFTCQIAVWSIRKGDRTRFLRAMAITLGLGITFLLMQAVDYYMLGNEKPVGLTLSSGIFGTTYYTLTGFHGAHVFGGVIMLAVVLYRGMAGQFSARHHDAVEAASLYWHFVDVVWILLFTILYLVPASS